MIIENHIIASILAVVDIFAAFIAAYAMTLYWSAYDYRNWVDKFMYPVMCLGIISHGLYKVQFFINDYPYYFAWQMFIVRMAFVCILTSNVCQLRKTGKAVLWQASLRHARS